MCKVPQTGEDEETSLSAGQGRSPREGDTSMAALGVFRSHQVNKEEEGIPGRWNSVCKGTERYKRRFRESAGSEVLLEMMGNERKGEWKASLGPDHEGPAVQL